MYIQYIHILAFVLLERMPLGQRLSDPPPEVYRGHLRLNVRHLSNYLSLYHFLFCRQGFWIVCGVLVGFLGRRCSMDAKALKGQPKIKKSDNYFNIKRPAKKNLKNDLHSVEIYILKKKFVLNLMRMNVIWIGLWIFDIVYTCYVNVLDSVDAGCCHE